MADWKKLAITWSVSTLVGFYTVFVLMELWNWFAIPLLGVPGAGYWMMCGFYLLLGLLTGRDDPQNPTQEKRWQMLFTVLDLCVPEDKMEELKGYVKSENQQVWAEVALHTLGVVTTRTLALGMGFIVHLLI